MYLHVVSGLTKAVAIAAFDRIRGDGRSSQGRWAVDPSGGGG